MTLPEPLTTPLPAPRTSSSPAAPSHPKPHGWHRWIQPVVAVVLFAVIVLALRHLLHEYKYRDIVREFRAISRGKIALACVIAVAGYAVLSIYDFLGLRYVKAHVPYPKVALASFISYAFGHSLGFSAVTSTAIRYRLYSHWGLSAGDVARVVTFVGATFFLGMFALGGAALMMEELSLPHWVHLPFGSTRIIGALLWVLLLAYLAWIFLRGRPLKLKEWEFPPPKPSIAIAQILVASLDWALAGSVMYVLLPPEHGLTLIKFLGVFLFAQSVGTLSHVPGGLGIFETLVVFMLSATVPGSTVLGALMAYRVIYYLVPLVLGALLLAGYEVGRNRPRLKRAVAIAEDAAPLVPWAMSAVSYLGGAILLVAGATPERHHRLSTLAADLPLALIEFSHFAATLVGVGLIVVGRGLQQRVRQAHSVTLVLLGLGAALLVMKGLDVESAGIMLLLLLIVAPTRREFHRDGPLTGPMSISWMLAVFSAVAGSVWIGAFVFRNVPYSSGLWTKFELLREGDAPRFLRASAGAIALALGVAIYNMFRRPVAPDVEAADEPLFH